MIQKIIQKIKHNPMEICLFVVLAIQFCLIAISNITLIDQNLDCDNANIFNHIATMWEEKTLAIPGWSYPSTLEWDCTTLFALPLYGLTKNIYLSCALSNTIFLALFIATIFFLFRGKELLYPLVCANLICIPYRVGMLDYYNMLFFAGGQYIVRVLVPLMLIAVLMAAEDLKNMSKREKRAYIAFSVGYMVLLLISSMSSGIYVTACGLVPVWVVYIFYKFFKWEKPANSVFLLGAASAVCALGGMIINAQIMGGARGNSMIFCSVYIMLGNVSSCFFGLFELLGGATTALDAAIFTVSGVIMLAKACLTVVILVCGIIALVRCIKKQGDLRLWLLLSIFIWNYFILNVSYARAGSDTYEYRYHLIGMIPLMCIAAIILVDGFRKNSVQQQRVLFVGGLAVLLFLSGASFGDLYRRGEQNVQLKEFCEYFEENGIGIDRVYMYCASNDADICRILDRDRMYIFVGDDGITWIYDHYEKYVNGQADPENAIVAVNDAEYDLGESFYIQDKKLVKYDSVGGRSLYYFEMAQ